MTDLSAQKRLAADELGVGKSRLWFDPDRQSDLAEAITREDIRELADEGAIQVDPKSGNSRGRARERQEKRSYGHQKGPGSRKGKSGAREDETEDWRSRIRAQRKRLRELRDADEISCSEYRTLYDRAGGGEFDSVADLERQLETRGDA